MVFIFWGASAKKKLTVVYSNQNSIRIEDRKGKVICAKPNVKGLYTNYQQDIPDRFKDLLVKKEDKYFFYHLGLNPISTGEVLLSYAGIGERKASSTISQQLVKILLNQESERNLKNKAIESLYTLAMELFQTKKEILTEYANSIYLGNKTQGIYEASRLYFGVDPAMLTDGQILQLLVAIASPNENNPEQDRNVDSARSLGKKLGLSEDSLIFTSGDSVRKNIEEYSRADDSCFELSAWDSGIAKNARLTIDSELASSVRNIARDNLISLSSKDANNAAVIVIKLPENEILASIGSPDPQSSEDGYKINMLREPRAIGSTIKPFIYLKAFERNLRPYTIVSDREYKYITALGFPLYPKNFDWKYRGDVTLHYALSNSLNVPAVKVLEYVGLNNFYKFLENDLGFKPIQPLSNYQLGIALGSLEMNLEDLAKYFTIFPNNGILRDLKAYQNDNAEEKKIADPKYIELINKILSDRRTGIEQFGLKSDLNLFQNNYALKTGTSRDYKDSWVVGYTPDFLVGVWVGNADSSAMDKVSGQAGAGKIWSETMELLLNSQYNKKTPFKLDLVKEFPDGENIEYGLASDNYEKQKNILKEKDDYLIITPHNGDAFLLEKNTTVFLKAKQKVKWYIDGKFLNESEASTFTPNEARLYKIKAESADGKNETVTISINQ